MPVDEKDITLERALVYKWIEAFNEHDVGAIVALYAENAELFDSGMKHPRHGCKEIKYWFSKRFESMPSITYTPIYQHFSGGQAAVTWIVRGRGPRILGQRWLARSFQVEGVSIFTLQDGIIQKQHGYYDHLSVLEQIFPPFKLMLLFRL